MTLKLKTAELALVRYRGTPEYTAGKLYYDGDLFCYTLEDQEREEEGMPVEEWKKKHITAIPRGRYRVTLSYSNKFKRILPILHGVEGFTGIRIHRGNKASHSSGCILIGMFDGDSEDDWVGNSTVAEKALIKLIENIERQGQWVYITVV